MNTEAIVIFLNNQENNLKYYKQKVAELEKNIEELKTIRIDVVNPYELKLEKGVYKNKEIEVAYIKAKIYEGLDISKQTTVLDTFISFLENKHHSQNHP